MEQVELVFGWLSSLHPVIPMVLAGLGSLVVVGGTYVAMTPSKTDDAWLAKLEAVPLLGHVLKALRAFSPFQKK